MIDHKRPIVCMNFPIEDPHDWCGHIYEPNWKFQKQTKTYDRHISHVFFYYAAWKPHGLVFYFTLKRWLFVRVHSLSTLAARDLSAESGQSDSCRFAFRAHLRLIHATTVPWCRHYLLKCVVLFHIFWIWNWWKIPEYKQSNNTNSKFVRSKNQAFSTYSSTNFRIDSNDVRSNFLVNIFLFLEWWMISKRAASAFTRSRHAK